jgi:hypothetical protein
MHSYSKTSDPKMENKYSVRQLLDVHYETYEVRNRKIASTSKDQERQKLLQAEMDSTSFYGRHYHSKLRRAFS